MLGARSALFLPFNNLGLIIVDEEHDPSFKQHQPAPRYHARDSAIYLANLHNAKVLLGSATPCVESYFNAKTGKYALVEMFTRFSGIALPKIQTIDIRKAHLKKQMTKQFAPKMLSSIVETLESGKQVILFQNRRGYSPVLSCGTCAHTPNCNSCDVSLTYHQTTNILKCHHCGFSEENDTKCKKCFKSTILKRGLGTQQVEEEVKNIFPEITVKRMDHDSTRKKNSFQEIISGFENNDFELLVGTQMLTKGLDFKNVALVGVLNADSLIYFPDFRSQEKCFQLLQQVAGRAGRVKKQGKVVIQTYNPKHDLMNKIVKNDYVGMFNEQLNQRFTFEYPPYSRLIKIILKNKDLNKLVKASDWLSQALRNEFKKELLGPESPLIARINNKHIKNILIKIPVNKSLIKSKDFINKIINSFRSISFFKSVDIIIDVDPYN
jgi:primosomal protein N' (replication factor Y)